MGSDQPESRCRVCRAPYGSEHDDGCTKARIGHTRVTLDDCAQSERVNHPSHYGGDTIYEAIKVIEAWDLGFCLGNTVKYIARAGKKNHANEIEDLKKARWYLDREIQRRETPV